LKPWLRAVALRTALNDARASVGAREVPLEEALCNALAATEADPELRYMKEHYRAEMLAALRAAVAALPARTRSLLQQYYLDGVGLRALATMRRLHVSNVSRSLAKAREALMSATLDELAGRLRIDPTELESVLRLVQSGLDASLSGLRSEEA
jgi:RNA polymerase sigma-70 factor, ECF subfamily